MDHLSSFSVMQGQKSQDSTYLYRKCSKKKKKNQRIDLTKPGELEVGEHEALAKNDIFKVVPAIL